MILSRVPGSERVFIDANIFLYSVFEHAVYGKSCRDFLKRIESNEIRVFTTDLVLNEVFHKLMIAEIAETEGTGPNNVAGIIKRRPEIIRELKRIWAEMELISSFGIVVLNAGTYPEFVRLSREYMLTAADAAHLAAMESFGIVSMASNDIDFQRVPWLKLWRPERMN